MIERKTSYEEGFHENLSETYLTDMEMDALRSITCQSLFSVFIENKEKKFHI